MLLNVKITVVAFIKMLVTTNLVPVEKGQVQSSTSPTLINATVLVQRVTTADGEREEHFAGRVGTDKNRKCWGRALCFA